MLPKLSIALETNKNQMDALCGGTTANKTLFVVGGLGHNIILKSTNGTSFKRWEIAYGRGLRGIHVDNRVALVCGEYGTVFRSTKGAFKNVKVDTGVCLFDIARGGDGTYWLGGEHGFLARSSNGSTWTNVKGLRGTIGKFQPTDDGMYIPTLDGLYQAKGTKVTKLGLARPVNQVIVTREGSLVAVGNANGIYRSDNGGKKFKPSKKPAFTAAKVPASKKISRPYWVKTSKDLNVIGELGDGRLVAAGDQGVILASEDDGLTFQRVPNKLFAGSIWGIATLNDSVYLAGEAKMILRVS